MYAQSSVQPTLQLAVSFGAKVYQANDIPTLASTAGINPYLATTIANYNAAIANGTIKQQLVPRAGTATPIATPPYYCFPFVVSGETSYGGVQINPEGNAIDADGIAIPGLYAAGSVMEGSLTGGGVEDSSGDYVGLLGSCLVFGVVSAESAAAYAKTR
jgi:succinate dehydrogenase/fumarate reductase flavoprotein subunit